MNEQTKRLADALDALVCVVGLTAIKHERQLAPLQEAVDLANKTLKDFRTYDAQPDEVARLKAERDAALQVSNDALDEAQESLRALKEVITERDRLKEGNERLRHENITLLARIAKLEKPDGLVSVEERLPNYELIKKGSVILPTDELLSDDCKSWEPIGCAWPIGNDYHPGFYKPMRRELPQPPEDAR